MQHLKSAFALGEPTNVGSETHGKIWQPSANEKLVGCAEAHFGEKVLHTSAPGSEGQASWRFLLENHSVIATLRPNFRRTPLEAFALTKISQYSNDIPKCLGIVGKIMFQSDVGGQRLNEAIVKFNRTRRAEVAHEAVAAIFRIQSTAQKAGLNSTIPHLGVNTDWIGNLVDAVSPESVTSQSKVFDLPIEIKHLSFI